MNDNPVKTLIRGEIGHYLRVCNVIWLMGLLCGHAWNVSDSEIRDTFIAERFKVTNYG